MKAKTNIESSFVKAKQATSISTVVGSDKAGWIKLTYTLPADKRRVGYIIKAKTTGYPVDEADGDTVYDDGNVTKNAVTFTYNVTNYTDGVKYYFSIFTYTYKNADKVYTTKNAPRCTAIPMQTSGKIIVDTSKVVDVPYGITKMTAFLVGGGGGGNLSGGGSGYTAKYEFDTTNIASITCVVGAGGSGAGSKENATDGGETYVLANGKKYSAAGGKAGTSAQGGAGGSGAGGYTYTNSSPSSGAYLYGADGGEDGSDGKTGESFFTSSTISAGGKGQGSTTTFDGIAYSGAGGGGAANINSNGTVSGYIIKLGAGGSGGGGTGGYYLANGNDIKYATSGIDGTGGGGGGKGYTTQVAGDGGSGVIILKWQTGE